MSNYVQSSFPFGIEGRIWDLVTSAPDHCLSFISQRHAVYKNQHLDYFCTSYSTITQKGITSQTG